MAGRSTRTSWIENPGRRRGRASRVPVGSGTSYTRLQPGNRRRNPNPGGNLYRTFGERSKGDSRSAWGRSQCALDQPPIAARSPSPNRLKPITVTRMASPGNVATHDDEIGR